MQSLSIQAKRDGQRQDFKRGTNESAQTSHTHAHVHTQHAAAATANTTTSTATKHRMLQSAVKSFSINMRAGEAT